MPYPTIDAPYGLKPINLIGGQVFAGSTRMYPIQYGYATNIYYGDFVSLTRGNVVRQAVTTTATNTFGIFLGCSFTNPVTKQKQFSQYWPSGTLAGDAVAYVCDDPDAVYKVAVCSATTVIGSANSAMVGQNMAVVNNVDLAGQANTGNSLIAALAVVAAGAPATTSTLPLRVMDVVRDTSVSVAATGSSTATTITLTGTGLPSAVLAGSEVGYLAANGQYIHTGSFLTTNYAAGTTSLAINLAIAVPGGVTAIPAASTIIFTQYPEVLVKVNFASHAYYAATAVA